MTVAVLMACHNRKRQTLACLRALQAQAWPAGARWKAFLVDDASTDGTAEAVKAEFPDCAVIRGTGSLYWCNSMRRAWERAAAEGFDFYLWLNDDTLLAPTAVRDLFATWHAVGQARDGLAIVVGSCRDPATGRHSYGGMLRPGRNPARLVPAPPSDEPRACDTFTGNIVLVPAAVHRRVGNLRRFAHSIGDSDYGLRAAARGCRSVVCAGYQGACAGNYYGANLYGLPLGRRLARVFDRKVFPPWSWLKYHVTHAGPAGMVFWASQLGVHLSRVLAGRRRTPAEGTPPP